MSGSIPNPENYTACALPTSQSTKYLFHNNFYDRYFQLGQVAGRAKPLIHTIFMMYCILTTIRVISVPSSAGGCFSFCMLRSCVIFPEHVSRLFLHDINRTAWGRDNRRSIRSASRAMLASATSKYRHCGATVIITSDRLVQSVLATGRTSTVMHRNN
jgi:hypothetical protein